MHKIITKYYIFQIFPILFNFALQNFLQVPQTQVLKKKILLLVIININLYSTYIQLTYIVIVTTTLLILTSFKKKTMQIFTRTLTLITYISVIKYTKRRYTKGRNNKNVRIAACLAQTATNRNAGIPVGIGVDWSSLA